MDHVRRDETTTFAPCHTTAFFVPNIQPSEPARTGSWGAGICLGTGVVATVEAEEADQGSIEVTRANADGDARVTREALRQLLERGDTTLPVRVECTVHEGAPVGQGFGISGASSLAAAFALARCLGKGRSEAVRAAHLAEVRNRSGLSDVAASFLGGVVLRNAPGLPPYGATKRLPVKGDVVVATVGDELDTGAILRDQEILKRITEVGKACMEAVGQQPSMETVIDQGARFARETDIVDEHTIRAVEACAEGGRAMAAMLGNTVVAYGDTETLTDVLSGFGEPMVVPIDQGGLRLFDKGTLEDALSNA